MMGSSKKGICDDEYSVIGDKGEIGFIDFEDDISVTSFDPTEEGPVLVSVPFPFIQRKPQSVLVGETSKCSITIENTTDDPVELWGVRIFCSNPADTFTLSLREPPSADSPPEKRRGFLEGYSLEDRVLQPRQTLTIWLSCKPKDLGLHTSVVYFDVGDERVERVVFLLAEDQVSQSLVSRRPYLRTPRRKQFAIDEYVVSSRPARAKTERPKKRLLEYPIPKDVRELINNKQVPAVLTEGLTMENYASFFSVLLIMEELHLEEDTRAYNMEGITMKRKGAQLLALEVPGLAERRPSLVHGDHVFVKAASANSGDSKVYEGYIYSVEADEVLLRFAKVFHDCHESRNLYDVRFTYNRVNMRRLYQAIEETASLDTDLLFPSQLTQRRSIQTAPFVPFTTTLNDEQRRSIEMILGCEGAPPYVIYGPPGTGKTKTLVEAILQVYMTRENSRVLVCAASNSAADHILEGLISNQAAEVKDNEVFRLNASSRSYQDVPAEYIRFCFFEDSIFTCPPCKALMHYRIIISTYMSSSLLYAEGIKMGHFSHIFLDEAGQASEPEIMVPISNFWERKTVVVLAGDPKQLGPVVYSKNAEAFGLGRSYLERLFECDHYGNEDEGFVTKLVRNYRCHPAILDLPSKLFYNGELLACKEDDSFISSNLDFLPNKEFPVLFFGIQGCDEREENNPSWFNRIEASKVVDLINKLRVSTEISEADIGVIAPYRQQVLKIKKVLETWDMLDVKVGSVEQFQGQEREVVIISTVRSTIKHNDFDRTFSLGFLSNPRRFNVAITRAKSLLIVVGNPHIVCKDPYWDKLLRHCSDNGSYQGCGLPEREEQADEVKAVAEWRDLTNLEEFPPSVTDETQWEEGWK